MTRITAIELENFQSIERKTRIDIKPITLFFGPNSAGKSSVFDALELLRLLLDPTAFNEQLASEMVDRWARRKGDNPVRETFIAVEFPFESLGLYEEWEDSSNWTESLHRTHGASFFLDLGDEEDQQDFEGKTIRIELRLKAVNSRGITECRLSEYNCFIMGRPIMMLTMKHPTEDDVEGLAERSGVKDEGERWLTINNDLGFSDLSLLKDLRALAGGTEEEKNRALRIQGELGERVQSLVFSKSLSPLKIMPSTIPHWYYYLKDAPNRICRNAFDILFYLGTMLFKPMRTQPGVVRSDRRAPNPSEALTFVDLGIRRQLKYSFAPSSPASLLMVTNGNIDEHFRGLAEVAHADLLLRTAKADFWGSQYAMEVIAPVRNRASAFDIVNHHLEKNLFVEKCYKLCCASTLLVPIDLDEDDPWSDYALTQPAAVRLFLQDGEGQKIELHDVGSGIPFVLPILYAIACQGFVKVQQPELHLHPALQSSIADVFVEELNRSGAGQFIIETHSEHLLLRLLRRIRDTEKNKNLAADMTLTQNEIAVYYFDPQVNGGTIVTRQLVTPLGDFYTDWPRGFFSERNLDLFEDE